MTDQTPPVAFLVVCESHVTEVEASVIRTGIRAYRHVASVEPIRNTRPAQIAHDRARAQVSGEIAPIFDELRSRILADCEAATEEIARVTDPGVEPGDTTPDTAGEPTGPVPTQRAEPAVSGETRVNGAGLPSRPARR